MLIRMNGVLPATGQSMVWAMAADPTLKGAALSGDVPFSGNINNTVVQVPGHPASSVIRQVDIGPDFYAFYGIKLLSGRALSWGDMMRRHSDFNVVINASAAKRFGFSPDAAIGESFVTRDDVLMPGHTVRATIVGVSADFMFESDRREIVPTVYSYDLRQ